MSRLLMAPAAAIALLAAGCAGAPRVDPTTIGNHPANPDAPTADFPPPSPTLIITDSATSQPMPANTRDHAGMDHNMPGINKSATTTQSAVSYTCSMHPEVHADAPGKCPKCGMKLVESKGGAQ